MFWFCSAAQATATEKEVEDSWGCCRLKKSPCFSGREDLQLVENIVGKLTSDLDHRKRRLRGVKLFESLGDFAIEECAQALQLLKYPAGTEIIVHGEQGEDCFIIDDGQCVAKVPGQKANDWIEVKTYEPGGFFGERALLRDEPRAASVVSVTDVLLFRITRENFVDMMNERHHKEGLIRSCKLFETMTDEQIAKLGGALQREDYKAGSTLFTQGEQGHHFYILDTGECAASIKLGDGKAQEVMRYKSGDLFGEKALLEKAPRGATITATTDVKVYCLSSKEFESKLGPLSQLHAEAYLADPRKLISDFFQPGDIRGPNGCLEKDGEKPDGTTTTSWFVVFRPCSRDSIAKMIGKVGVGKGLNVKGKSSKKNRLSGFVPFVQISDNSHKSQLERSPSDARVIIYFKTSECRLVAHAALSKILKEDSVRKTIDVPELILLNGYQPDAFGIDMPEPLMKEAYIMRHDLSPMVGWETGRNSEPAFMDMNFHSARGNSSPKVVVYQFDSADAMNPLGLLCAYAETEVKPVVSDFDTFTVGSRGMSYDILPPKQAELVDWSLLHTEEVLSKPGAKGWNSRWLEVLKAEADKGFHPEIPKYGFGDPTSVKLIVDIVEKLEACGAVRHGAECFNFYFPQELDDEFLIIWDGFEDPPWKTATEPEVREFLLARAKEGYAFPVNPVWPARDPGWYEVFQALRESPEAKGPMASWFTEKMYATIDRLHDNHPKGFFTTNSNVVRRKSTMKLTLDFSNEEMMNMAGNEVRKVVNARWRRARNNIIMMARMKCVLQSHRNQPKLQRPWWSEEPGRSAKFTESEALHAS